MPGDATEHPPFAGDSQETFAANQLPSCDEVDCGDSVDYLSQHGGYCDYHAWTNGVQRWSPDRSVDAGAQRSEGGGVDG
jgi:hypothetical protein